MLDEDIDIWRRFKNGESAAIISKRFNIPMKMVLLIVLSVECEMGSSTIFNKFTGSFDGEGFPESLPTCPRIPTELNCLESFLKNA